MKNSSFHHRKKRFWTTNLDFLFLIVGLIGIVLLFLNITNKTLWIFVIGIVGFVLWALYFYVWIARPTKRDWILVNSHIMRRIASGVLLAPFALVFVYTLPILMDGNTNKTSICYLPLTRTTSPTPCHDNESPQAVNAKGSAESAQGMPDADSISATDFFLEVYYNFMDPGAQKESGAVIGKEWAAIIAMLGVFLLNGLLVSTIVGWFDRRREQWLKGSIRYKHLHCKSLYVIIGGNEMSLGIVNSIFEKDANATILIETAQDVESYRRMLFSNMQPENCEQTILYYGNRTSKEDLRNLHLNKAKELYILGEDVELGDTFSHHDALNMKCLELVAEVYKEKMNQQKANNGQRLKCMVMFEYQSTFSIFQFSEISENIKDALDFIPFNRYEMWAQKVLICKEMEDPKKCKYLPLEGFEGIQSNDKHFVHLVIVGMSRMGTALAIEAAHLAHYPNFVTQKVRTRITFIDSNMKQEYDYFRGRFDALLKCAHSRYIDVSKAQQPFYEDEEHFPWEKPLSTSNSPSELSHLGDDFLDIEWEFIDSSVEKPIIQEYLSEAASNPLAKLTLAVCLPETNKSVATAIYLPQPVFKHALQVLIYQSANNALISNFSNNQRMTPFNGKLKGFGMLRDTYDASIVEQSCRIAEQLDLAYAKSQKEKRTYYLNLGQALMQEFDGQAPSVAHSPYGKIYDTEIQPGIATIKEEVNHNFHATEIGKTPVSKWWSNRYHANSIWTKLRCLHPQETELTPEQLWLGSNVEHNRWNMEQLLMLYSPVSYEQQCFIRTAKNQDEFEHYKNFFKNRMIHYNICSCHRLKEIDENYYIDVAMTAALPHILQILENKDPNLKTI